MARHLRQLPIYLVIAVIAAGGVYLVRENRTLADQNRDLLRRAVEPRPGLYVPEADAVTLDGRPVVLGQVGRRQLLVFFNTTCRYCRASVPAWRQIAERLVGDSGLAMYGVALDSAAAVTAYAAQHELRFPLMARPDPRLVALYRVAIVPLVLVVEDGRVAYARMGLLETAAAIDSVLHAARASAVPPNPDAAPSIRPGFPQGG
jgi:peroxiredoxin